MILHRRQPYVTRYSCGRTRLRLTATNANAPAIAATTTIKSAQAGKPVDEADAFAGSALAASAVPLRFEPSGSTTDDDLYAFEPAGVCAEGFEAAGCVVLGCAVFGELVAVDFAESARCVVTFGIGSGPTA